MTGNVALGGILIFVFTPLYNKYILDDERNLHQKIEKAYMNSKIMFMIPAWFTIFGFLLVHIYILAMYSTNWKPDLPIFQHKPETWPQLILFSFMIGFFGALSSTAGHELVHWPETANKIVGNLPYVEVFYSHFWDEHVHSHHKNLATDDDPVCHKVGVSLYAAIP